MRGFLLLMAAGALGLLAAPAAAQDTPQYRRACAGSEPAYSPSDQMAGCTAMIEAGGAKPSDLAVAFSNRGILYARQEQYARARRDFDQAIRLNPKSAPAFHNRGLTYDSEGKYARAIEDYDEAIRLNPDLAPAYYLRSVAERHLGRTAAAKADMAKARALNPDIGK